MIYNNITYVKPDLDDIYPIGSIYISTDSTNPAQLFGGIWERIEDRFLLAAGDRYTPGSTGGSTTQTLIGENLPWSAICVAQNTTDSSKSIGGASWTQINVEKDKYILTTREMAKQLIEPTLVSDQPIDIMPTYIAVYVWKRVGTATDLIMFTIHNGKNDISFTARKYMTFDEWVHSSYNTEGFYIDTNYYICAPDGFYKHGGNPFLYYEGKDIRPTDKIIIGAQYELTTGG